MMMAVFPNPRKGKKSAFEGWREPKSTFGTPLGVDPDGQRGHLEAVPELLPEFKC
jgi:hypothetical protein